MTFGFEGVIPSIRGFLGIDRISRYTVVASDLLAEDPQVRFAKSLGFYEDADWTLNRASIGVSQLSVPVPCRCRAVS